MKPEHTEFRDDRFVAAFNFFGPGSTASRRARRRRQRDADGERRDANAARSHVGRRVAYIVRAVTPGSFVHPAATVEDMYRPERFARTAAGTLAVTAK